MSGPQIASATWKCDRAGVRVGRCWNGKGRRSVLIGKVGVVRLLMNCARGNKE